MGKHRRFFRLLTAAAVVAISVAAIDSGEGREPGPRAVVGEHVLVSTDLPDRPHVEPYLAVDPLDPRHLVAGAMAFTRPDPWPTCTSFVSWNGGTSWQRVALPGLEGTTMAADPWVAFDGRGGVFLSCLVDGPGGVRPWVWRSLDGARTWSPPVPAAPEGGEPHDHPVIAIGKTGPSGPATVYVASVQVVGHPRIPHLLRAVALASSADSGKSFTAPVTTIPSSLNLNIGGVAVLSDGSVVIPFLDFQGPTGWLTSSRLWVLRATGPGRAFSFPYFVAERGGGLFPSLARSAVGGERLHLVWSRSANEPGGVFAVRSEDGGETWSPPVAVDDAPPSALRVIPTAAVDSQGRVAVSWLDNRHAEGGLCWDLYVSVSRDGGGSFEPGVRVTTEPSCPDVPGNRVSGEGGEGFAVAGRWRFGGDYMGLAAVGPGRFQLLWADSRNGRYQLWTTTVDLGGSG